MWFTLQLSTRKYLFGIFSILEKCFFWKKSEVHSKLIGANYPKKKIVLSRSLRHVQPEDLRINPKIQLYNTQEMLKVLSDSPGGGPRLARYVSDVLNHGKVTNYFDFAFSGIYNEGPEFDARLGGYFPHRPFLKQVLNNFGNYITKKYWTRKNLQRRGFGPSSRTDFFRRENRVVRGRGRGRTTYTGPPRFHNRRTEPPETEPMSYPPSNQWTGSAWNRPSGSEHTAGPSSRSVTPPTAPLSTNRNGLEKTTGNERSSSQSTASSEGSVYEDTQTTADIHSPSHQREVSTTRPSVENVKRVGGNCENSRFGRTFDRLSKYRFHGSDEEIPKVLSNRNHMDLDHSRDSADHPHQETEGIQRETSRYILIPSPTHKLKATFLRVEEPSNSRFKRTIYGSSKNRSDGIPEEERSVPPNSNYREPDQSRDCTGRPNQWKRSRDGSPRDENSVRHNSYYQELDQSHDFTGRPHQWKRSWDGYTGEESSVPPNSINFEPDQSRDFTGRPHQWKRSWDPERPMRLNGNHWDFPSRGFNGHPYQQNYY